MIPRVLVLAGPTAAGKTAAALLLAERSGAVIVSADAMQVYRGFDIGTAKATPEERARVPHFGIDEVDPDGSFDAAAFVRLVDRVLVDHPRVMLVGGTSLYLRSAIRGLVPTPEVDPALRARLAALPDPHAALVGVDPELAARLHPNDHVRIVRGLEVYHATGDRLSRLQEVHASMPDRLEARGLWLDRADLRGRIVSRLDRMVADGWIGETERLLREGVDPEGHPMQSFAYRHAVAHVRDGLALEEAVRRTERDTWLFARKQRNWMRVLGWPRQEGGAPPEGWAEGWWS